MKILRKLSTKDTAILICFTALYSIFSIIPTFPVIGLTTIRIPLATMISPVIGIVIGPFLGFFATLIGGLIGFYSGFYSPMSLVSGIVTAIFAGMAYSKLKKYTLLFYLSLLCLFAFHPVGPFWLFPPFLWFQIVGFFLLFFLNSSIFKRSNSKNNVKLSIQIFIISLTSTLAGQISGSLTFEMLWWPYLIPEASFWSTTWRFIIWIYPIERMIIALISTSVGVSLYKVLNLSFSNLVSRD